jgi:DnaJ family protein A protein 2
MHSHELNDTCIGETIAEKDKCGTCQGHKVVAETKIVEVPIQRGAQHAQKIPLHGEGDQMVCLYV